ncbi:hypothetical protein [uncultured Corynebacterium sp.]|uniref:helix-turn-helix domain-containing protein n=1 Tax=uncultured Corynebacterium sp. TaxID=159447 RepID=UPI002617B02E|nr:hypothetical protein [uncultured Corynebacterium sp.]
MTPTELRIQRRALGLTTVDIAQIFEVNHRTAQRWESTHTPPNDVAEWVTDRIGLYVDRVADVLDMAEQLGAATLVRYADDAECMAATGLSRSEHEALLGHCCIALTAAGFGFQIL